MLKVQRLLIRTKKAQSYTVPNTETNPETNPVPSYISITAVGTPPVVPGDDDFTGGDSGAGGAVAAVLVGGAAVWGGYEITTRVILHNILPGGRRDPPQTAASWHCWCGTPQADLNL